MLSPLFYLIGHTMGMNASQRRLWLQAVRSSYTLGETRPILRKSGFKDVRVKIIPWIFELGIEWRKPLEEIR